MSCCGHVGRGAVFQALMVGPDRDRASREIGAVVGSIPGRALVNGYKGLGGQPVYAEADYVSSRHLLPQGGRCPRRGGRFPARGSRQLGTPGRLSIGQQVAAMRPGLQSWIDTNSQRDPQGTAAQQLKFDCWIEELHEGRVRRRQRLQARPPRRGQKRPRAVGCRRAPPPSSTRTAKLCQGRPSSTSPWDRYDLLNPRGRTDRRQTVRSPGPAALDLMVRQDPDHQGRPAIDLVIGRADASGPEDYNYGLSGVPRPARVRRLPSRPPRAHRPGSIVRHHPARQDRPHRADARWAVRDPANPFVVAGSPTRPTATHRRPATPAPKPKEGPLQLRRPAPPLPRPAE